jgi:hypothetical protein
MRAKIIIPILMIAVFFAACSNSENNNDNTTKTDSVAATAKTVLKVTKQYVTNSDGSVTESTVNAEVGYNEQEVTVTFKDSADKSFTVKATSLEKKVEGVTIMLKDRKYKEVFVSSGAQPQVTFTSDKGFGNMTLM